MIVYGDSYRYAVPPAVVPVIPDSNCCIKADVLHFLGRRMYIYIFIDSIPSQHRSYPPSALFHADFELQLRTMMPS